MKHIELAKRIKALAERGIAGEKINAQKLLADLLAKHHISIEDIEGEKQSDYFFKLRTQDVRLWNQIVKKVNYTIKTYGVFPAKKVKEFGLEGNCFITCTASEYIEIESMNAIYQRLFKQEREIFYTAFLKANNLLIQSSEAKDVNDLTPEEFRDWMRMNQMSTNIKSETIKKQLKSGS